MGVGGFKRLLPAPPLRPPAQFGGTLSRLLRQAWGHCGYILHLFRGPLPTGGMIQEKMQLRVIVDSKHISTNIGNAMIEISD